MRVAYRFVLRAGTEDGAVDITTQERFRAQRHLERRRSENTVQSKSVLKSYFKLIVIQNTDKNALFNKFTAWR